MDFELTPYPAAATGLPSPPVEPAPPADRYDAYYYAHGCGNHPYQRDDVWLGFFGGVADLIVAQIAPRTVLDVGCAMGFLVECLRERGVEAYGVDVSEYAISHVHPSVAPYCRIGSADEPFGRQYDLITCIEVVEHLSPDLSGRTLANLCRHTGDLLFSSSPEDFAELTHHNVQPPEYWAARFAELGFWRDLDFDGSRLTPWAARFRHAADPPVAALVTGYERRLWWLARAADARQAEALRWRDGQLAAEAALAELKANLARQIEARGATEAGLAERETKVAELTAELGRWQADRRTLEASVGGRLLRRLQALRAHAAPPGSRRDRWLERVGGLRE